MSAELTATLHGSLLTLEATLATAQASLDAGALPSELIRWTDNILRTLDGRARRLPEPAGTLIPKLFCAAADHLDKALFDLHRTPYHVQQARLHLKEAIRIMMDGAAVAASARV